MRRRAWTAGGLLLAMLAGCGGQPDAPIDTGGAFGRVGLASRAHDLVAPKYQVARVEVVPEHGAGDTGIVGYNAWVYPRICRGRVLIQMDRQGRIRSMDDGVSC